MEQKKHSEHIEYNVAVLTVRPAWLILMTFIDNFRCANNDNEGHYWRGKTNKI